MATPEEPSVGRLEAQAESLLAQDSVGALPAHEAAKGPNKRIQLASAISESLATMQPEEVEKRLAEYFEAAEFVDATVRPQMIADAITYATGEGRNSPDRRLSPLPSDISAQIGALKRLKENGEAVNVVAINVGGTSTKATSATVKGGRVILKQVEELAFRDESEKGKPIECEDNLDYWKRTIPAGMIETLRLAAASGTTAIGVSLPLPTLKGKVVHMSDKAVFQKYPLGPKNETQSREEGDLSNYPTIAASFSAFLASEGIDIPEGAIFTGENDTVGIILGRPEKVEAMLENDGGVMGSVDGTGFNSCGFKDEDGEVKGYNLEMGHLTGLDKSSLDNQVSSKEGMKVDLESLVSGKILGNVLKHTLKELTPEGSPISTLLEPLNNEKATALLFTVGLGGALPQETAAWTEAERQLLVKVCEKFTQRATKYLHATLEGIAISMGLAGKACAIVEGSVYDKNQALVDGVNHLAGREIIVKLEPVNAENQTGRDLEGISKLKVGERINEGRWGR